MRTVYLGLTLDQVPDAMEPWNIFPRYKGKDLESAGFIQWDEGAEHWKHTEQGAERLEAWHEQHRITLGTDHGGPRWFLGGKPISCGNGIEVLRPDATWLPVRFEVAWGEKDAALYDAGGRSPRLYIEMAGGPALVSASQGFKFMICRWPSKEDN